MLDTEWATGNIFKRLRSKTKGSDINVLYNEPKEIFDQIIQSSLSDICLIDPRVGHALFHYDFTSFNSVFLSAKEISNVYNTYTNIIMFNHSDISNIKKEDKIILNNNLLNIKIINFNSKSNEMFDKSLNINYPFPDFKDSKIERIKDLLIVNTDDNNITENLFNSIKNNTDISVDICKTLTNNIEALKNQMSQYKIVLDLSNRLVHILALLSGCTVLTHKSIDGYLESPYIVKFNTLNTIVDSIKLYTQKHSSNTEQIKQIYTSKGFSDKFKEYIYGNY